MMLYPAMSELLEQVPSRHRLMAEALYRLIRRR